MRVFQGLSFGKIWQPPMTGAPPGLPPLLPDELPEPPLLPAPPLLPPVLLP
jgi:hypothetical protein